MLFTKTLIALNINVGNLKKPTTSSIQGLYTYGIATRAASQSWLGMGGQVIGVREVSDSIPGGITPFDRIRFSFKMRLEREDGEKSVKVNHNVFNDT